MASAIGSAFDCGMSLASDEDVFLECFFSRVGFGLFRGRWRRLFLAVDCGAGAAAIAGPTCKLLTTSFTPGTDAA